MGLPKALYGKKYNMFSPKNPTCSLALKLNKNSHSQIYLIILGNSGIARDDVGYCYRILTVTEVFDDKLNDIAQ